MSALSNYLEKSIVDHFLNAGAAIPQASNLYLGLYETNPQDDNSGQECNYQGYSRKECSWTILQGNQTTSNAEGITFDAKQDGDDVIVYYAAVFNDSVAGELLFYGQLAKPKTLGQNDVIAFAAGAITLSLF